MRPVEMDRTGILAAAMYAILDDRRYKDLLSSFSVRVELEPVANDEVLFGSTISGYIQLDSIRRREFAIQHIHDGDYGDIKVEVPYMMEHYGVDKSITRIDVKEPVEINFDKRTITYKHVHTLNMKNVAWDWQTVKAAAADIIGVILGEENS